MPPCCTKKTYEEIKCPKGHTSINFIMSAADCKFEPKSTESDENKAPSFKRLPDGTLIKVKSDFGCPLQDYLNNTRLGISLKKSLFSWWSDQLEKKNPLAPRALMLQSLNASALGGFPLYFNASHFKIREKNPSQLKNLCLLDRLLAVLSLKE